MQLKVAFECHCARAVLRREWPLSLCRSRQTLIKALQLR
jgi:hypothetical protein